MKNQNVVPAANLERETGLTSDLLRKWRFRYGFPVPEKQADASLGYPREQINQLRLIKRLLDAGFRPSMIVGKSLVDLERLATVMSDPICVPPENIVIDKTIELLKTHAIDELNKFLAADLAQRGLTEFVRSTVAPLAESLGDAWSKGKIEVYHEHVCTEILKRLLFSAMAVAQPKPGYPRIIFSTPSDELHILGVSMAQAVLADQGAHCFSVGPQMPNDQLDKVARGWKADIVAISFSFAYPARRIRPLLVHLRTLLPENIEIWAGGAGVNHIKRISAGIRIFTNLDQAVKALQERVAVSRPTNQTA